MVLGALGRLDDHYYVWASSFAGSAVLAWGFLRGWRWLPTRRRRRIRLPPSLAWRGTLPNELATVCERRIGRHATRRHRPLSPAILRRTASSPSPAMASGFSRT